MATLLLPFPLLLRRCGLCDAPGFASSWPPQAMPRPLLGYLEGMAIRDCIERPYGVDLAGVGKANPEFYRAVFTDAGVDPAEAVVVDDRPEAAAWAAEAGAGLAVLVGRDIPALADLPRHLGTSDRLGLAP